MKKKIIFYVLIINISLLSQQNINFELAGFHPSDQFVVNNEPSVAINPTDSNNIVIATNYRDLTGISYPQYDSALLGIYYKTSPTGSWNFSSLPQMDLDLSVDPSIAFDNNGKLWCAYIGYNHSMVVGGVYDETFGVYANYSTNKGATWLQYSYTIEEVSQQDLDLDKTYIHINQYTNQVFIAYSQAYLNIPLINEERKRIKISAYDFETNSFTQPFVLNDENNIGYVQAPYIITDQSDNIYVFFYCRRIVPTDEYQIRCVKLSFDGSNFYKIWEKVVSDLTPIDDYLGIAPYHFRTVNQPVAVVSPGTGNMHIIWADKVNGRAQIMMSNSSDDGETWSSKYPVDDLPSGEQFFPWITFSENNRMNIIYYYMYSSTADVISPVYLTSFDGGTTFHKTKFVNDDFVFHYTYTNWPDNLNFIGDYIGISSNNDEIIAAYTGNNIIQTNTELL